jgi:3-oxoacyl-[acyl-carrier protein] reductase
MKFDFKNKNILITGASRGIGKSIAKEFHKLGANILGTSTTKSLKKNRFELIKVNFFNKKELKIFCDYLKNKKIDILINNAGINKISSIENININDVRNILYINLEIPTLITSIVSKNMIKKKNGKIINISSIFGLISKEKRSSYSSSKFGILGLTKSSALDLANKNILINSISPGFIDTDLTRKILKISGMKKIAKTIPMRRLGDIKEVANLSIFLASNYNTYITGQNIVIDGGFTIK